MKKIILVVAIACLAVNVKAQLLVTDSSFSSNDGVIFTLSGVDSSYHDAGNCRLAYSYSKRYDASTQQLTNFIYTTNDYFANGNLRQMVTQLWNNGSHIYVNNSRSTIAYYLTTSNILTNLTEIWVNNSAWRNANLQTNTYDANGYLTLSVHQTWDVASAAWTKDQETVYYNRSNGLKDSSIEKDYTNNAVTHRTKNIYSYVGNTAQPFQIITQTLVNNQWQDSARSTQTYNPTGKITVVDIEFYSPQTQSWTPFSHFTFTYNSAGELVLSTQTISYFGFTFVTQTRYRPKSCGGLIVLPGELCPAGNTTLNAGLTGTTYQWQVSTNGINFNNISNSSNYSGTNTAALNLSNIPSAWYGYQYRCVVNGQNSSVITIKFVAKWTGTTSNIWGNPANWSCGTVPDANTDAIISSGSVMVNSNVSVRSLTVNPGAAVTTNTGARLIIIH